MILFAREKYNSVCRRLYLHMYICICNWLHIISFNYCISTCTHIYTKKKHLRILFKYVYLKVIKASGCRCCNWLISGKSKQQLHNVASMSAVTSHQQRFFAVAELLAALKFSLSFVCSHKTSQFILAALNAEKQRESAGSDKWMHIYIYIYKVKFIYADTCKVIWASIIPLTFIYSHTYISWLFVYIAHKIVVKV